MEKKGKEEHRAGEGMLAREVKGGEKQKGKRDKQLEEGKGKERKS